MGRLLVSEAFVGSTRVVAASGEIDIENANELEEMLARTRTDVVIVSLLNVRYIDSSGLAALVKEHNRRKRGPGPLLIVLPLPPADRVFRITQLDSVLRCFRELDDAVEEAGGQNAPPVQAPTD